MLFALGGGVVLLVTITGCSPSEPTPETIVVFDGQRFTLDGFVDCVRQLDGTLAINAPVSAKWGGSPPAAAES
jgi:hypothetical protein